MRITLAQLETFASVARFGSVLEASRQLNFAQPTISLRLKDLESTLGVKLFDRSGRGLRLSHEGMAMLEHANRILGEVGKLKSRAGSDEVSGLVRLGVSEAFAVAGLPSLLKSLAAEYPDLRVELAIGPSPDLIQDMLEHRLDLAIAINPGDDPRLRILALGVQPATWAAMPGLNLPAVVRPPDLLHHTVLLNPSPSPNYRQVMAWFGSAGLEPLHVSVCSTVPSVIAHLVEAGIGVGILPTKLIEPQLKAGTLVALSCRPAIESSYLCAVHSAADHDPRLDAVIGATRRILASHELLEPV